LPGTDFDRQSGNQWPGTREEAAREIQIALEGAPEAALEAGFAKITAPAFFGNRCRPNHEYSLHFEQQVIC